MKPDALVTLGAVASLAAMLPLARRATLRSAALAGAAIRSYCGTSSDLPLPTTAVMRCSVPTSATMAILVSKIEKLASAEHRRMSQAVTRSIPPPMQ